MSKSAHIIEHDALSDDIRSKFKPVYYAQDMGIIGDGVTDDSPAIAAAMVTISAAGSGVLKFGARSYYMASAVTPMRGVTIKGVMWTATNTDSVYVSGTRFVGNGTNDGFAWSPGATDYVDNTAGSQPTGGNATLQCKHNFNIHSCAFTNFKAAIRGGALKSSGFYRGQFFDILVENGTEWGVYFENCSQSEWRNIQVRRMLITAIGGMYFGTSQNAFAHGNSQIERLYCNNVFRYLRGIVFNARAGSNYNQMCATSVMCNQHVLGAETETVSYTSGSPNFTVANSALYKIDEAVGFYEAGSTHGITQYKTFFVTSMPDSATITLSYKQRGTSFSPTGSGSKTIQRFGFPNVEVSAYDAETIYGADSLAISNFQSITVTDIDAEGDSPCSVFVQNANIDLGITVVKGGFGGQGVTCLSHLVARNAQGPWRSTASLTVDISDNVGNSGATPFHALGAHIVNWGAGRCPSGMYYDASTTQYCLNLSADSAVDGVYPASLITQKVGTKRFTYPGIAMGQKANYSSGTAVTLTATDAGSLVFAGTANGVWILPALQSGRGGTGATFTAGLEYEIINNTAFTLTINAAGTDKFKFSGSAITSYVLTQGQSIKIRAQWIATSTVFWAVIGAVGVTP